TLCDDDVLLSSLLTRDDYSIFGYYVGTRIKWIHARRVAVRRHMFWFLRVKGTHRVFPHVIRFGGVPQATVDSASPYFVPGAVIGALHWPKSCFLVPAKGPLAPRTPR